MHLDGVHPLAQLALEPAAPHLGQRKWQVAVAGGELGTVGADQVERSNGRQHGCCALLEVERPHQRSSQVLGASEWSKEVRSEQGRTRRIGPEEVGCAAQHLAVGDHMVDRHVMPTEPPAPRRSA